MTNRAPVLSSHATRTGDGPAVAMTLREHYAGLALQGFAAGGRFDKVPDATVAEWAVAYADALIAALAVPREDGQ